MNEDVLLVIAGIVFLAIYVTFLYNKLKPKRKK